jgi:hypothetical protein
MFTLALFLFKENLNYYKLAGLEATCLYVNDV